MHRQQILSGFYKDFAHMLDVTVVSEIRCFNLYRLCLTAFLDKMTYMYECILICSHIIINNYYYNDEHFLNLHRL